MEKNKKILKIGVMGCRMGGAHAKCFKALEDYAVVTAICEKDTETYSKVEGWVKPETKFYTDFDEFIHSGIDAANLISHVINRIKISTVYSKCIFPSILF